MVQALTPPLMVACLLLVVAGLAKLRSPEPAAGALLVLAPGASGALGPAGRRVVVRAGAVVEVVLGVLCAVHPSPAAELTLAGVYLLFAAITLVLARRQSACGCFGSCAAPASAAQSALSLALAALAAATVLGGAHGLGWLLTRAPASAPVLAAGLAGAVYAGVTAYRELPGAWAAWSGG